MRFLNVLTELWCKPWVIMPEVHSKMCAIVEQHLSGEAHQQNGIAFNYEIGNKRVERVYMGAATALAPDAAIGEPSAPARPFQVEQNVAVIPVKGVIGKGVGAIQKSSGVMDVDDLTAQVQAAVEAEDILGIFMDVNSPGGSVTGVPEAARVIAQAAGQKPVVAFTDTLMASAAYWLASQATAIYATQSASVGSIGVYMAWLDESRAMEMRGERTELIKQGKFKAVGLRGLTLTDDQRDLLQAEVDKVAGWFKGDVRTGRGTVADDAMEGQTFFGEDAVTENLVDAVGDADAAMDELRAMIGREDGAE